MTATVTSAVRGASASLVAPLACGCCLVGGAAYVTVVDPSDGGLFLPCPFRALTGWWCPGCGLTRATHHLFRGEVIQALRFNLFVVAVLVSIAAAWTAWSATAAGRPIGRWAAPPAWITGAALVALTVFAVVRNLPGVTGLRG